VTPTRISAIVPVHDRSESLAEAVESLVATGYPDLEVVVVEDGAGEETAVRARALEARFPGVVRAVRHPDGRNRGPGPSRNRGVWESTGEYICFLDSDDVVLPGRFARAPSALDADRSLDAVCERFLRDSGSAAGASVPSRDRSGLRAALLGPGPLWHTGSILMRRRSFLDLGGFSESLRTSEDWVLWIKLALAGRVGDGGPEPVSIYRRHGANTEPILENSLLAFLEVIRWSRGRDLPADPRRLLREAAWGKLLYVCDRLRRSGRRGRAARLLAEAATAVPAFTLRPEYWRNVARCCLPGGRGRESPA
jgi:glycosyltransferase involved in cell wall biosynthesis